MTVRLYVSNLSYNVTARELEELFSTQGEVFIATMKEPGWGLVEMQTLGGASKAIENLRGQRWHGRDIVVRYANSTSDYTQKTHEGRRFTTSDTSDWKYKTRKPKPPKPSN